MAVPKHLKKLEQKSKAEFREEVKNLASLMDQLAVFSEWKEVILPEIKEDLQSGATAKDLRKKYLPHLQARLISLGLTCPDPKTALSAIRDSVDREEGKAMERKDIRHSLEQLPDEELNALLLTKLSDTQSNDKKKVVN